MTNKQTLMGSGSRAFFPTGGLNMMTRGPQVFYAPEDDSGGGGGAPPPAGDPPPAAGDPAPAGGPPSIFDDADGGGDPPPADPAPKEGEEKPPEDADKDKDKAEGAPEAYEAFKVPEGVEIDEVLLADATPIFKELGLPQDKAQKLIDLWTKIGTDAEAANAKIIQDHNNALIKAVKEDPDLGGAHLKTTLASAKTAIAKFGSPELEKLLITTGIGNEPAVLRFLVKVAAFDADDTLERGKGPGPGTAKFGDFYDPEIMKQKD